ncbi:MAG: glycosyltransferase family 2 protein [Clostridia bacterium]|nr:glycosyltransferase family 2 protein [Clostridia bacterium]
MKISVIMPVYNCESYLEAALQSVLAQSVRDLEIIAVEDCSTDASRDILLRTAQKDARIRPICNEKNIGVAVVRNLALEHVTGEFVAFCDADDIVPDGAYEKLLGAIGDRDIAIGAFDDALDRGDGAFEREPRPIDAKTKKSMFLSLFSVCCLWTKLIRTSFIRENGLRFDEDMQIGEDVVFLAHVATKNPSYAVIDDTVYWHCRYQGARYCSLTHIYTLDAYRQHIECRRRLLSVCREIPECRDYVYLRFSWDAERYLHLLTDENDLEEAFAIFRDYMSGYDFREKPLLFESMTGVPYEKFLGMDAVHYFEYQKEVLPRERVATEFACGMIGFRWIVRYFKGWLKFKFKRNYQ